MHPREIEEDVPLKELMVSFDSHNACVDLCADTAVEESVNNPEHGHEGQGSSA